MDTLSNKKTVRVDDVEEQAEQAKADSFQAVISTPVEPFAGRVWKD